MANVDYTQQSPAILSLCTGLLRGLEVGIEHALQTKLRTVAYVEIEAFAIDNLLQGMEKGILDAAPIWSNLKTFPYRQFHGKIFGITGGYPCQPFSVAGKRKGRNDPRHLWPYIYRIVQSTKPVFCFFENVEGHLNLGFEEVSRDLRKVGYRVEAGLYSAEEVGATHKRKRLFILAIRESELANTNDLIGRLSEPAERRNNNEVARSGKTNVGNPDNTNRGRACNGLQHEAFGQSCSGGFETASEAVGNSENRNEQRIWECEPCSQITNRGLCSEVEHSTSERLSQSIQAGIGQFSEKTKERLDDRFKQSGNAELADTNNKRLQGWECGELCECSRECTARPSSAFKSFPARPGQPQHEWEAPRTVESGMGITIDGYNFREDLLRGAGNGVVWQTASLAFIDLLKKF